MPRLTATTAPPRGGIADRLAAMQVTTLTIVRAGAVLGTEDVYLDFTAKGREILLGQASTITSGNSGFGGAADGVALYAPYDADLHVADVFAHDGAQYMVEYVAPLAMSHVSGAVMQMAWASAQRDS